MFRSPRKLISPIVPSSPVRLNRTARLAWHGILFNKWVPRNRADPTTPPQWQMPSPKELYDSTKITVFSMDNGIGKHFQSTRRSILRDALSSKRQLGSWDIHTSWFHLTFYWPLLAFVFSNTQKKFNYLIKKCATPPLRLVDWKIKNVQVYSVAPPAPTLGWAGPVPCRV